MKICILEDDRAQTERMIEYLKRYQGEHGEFSYVLETYSQAFDLLNAYRGDADLVFLDIRLPDQLGIFPFSYSLQRRRHFLLRLAVSLGGGMLAVEILTRLLFAQGLVAEFAVITMLYVLLNLIVWFCYKESAWTALFVTASGLCTAGYGQRCESRPALYAAHQAVCGYDRYHTRRFLVF